MSASFEPIGASQQKEGEDALKGETMKKALGVALITLVGSLTWGQTSKTNETQLPGVTLKLEGVRKGSYLAKEIEKENAAIRKGVAEDMAKEKAAPPTLHQLKPIDQVCPAAITHFFNVSTAALYGVPPDSTTGINVTNISNKPISVAIVKLQRINAINEPLPLILGEFNVGSLGGPSTAPGKVIDTGLFESNGDDVESYAESPFLKSGDYLVWVYGVRFADGTIWKDNGTHSCAAMKHLVQR